MNATQHILLSEVPSVKPRRAKRDPWERASDNPQGWRLIRETVQIERIIDRGGMFRVELSTGHKLTVNGELLTSPTSVAQNVEEITGKPLGVPADIETIDGWLPYIRTLIKYPEA